MKPDCYQCAHRRNVPGSAHSRCNNFEANVEGSKHGIEKGWFLWPVNFDPTWLVSCDGFSDDHEDRKAPTRQASGLAEIFGILRG